MAAKLFICYSLELEGMNKKYVTGLQHGRPVTYESKTVVVISTYGND